MSQSRFQCLLVELEVVNHLPSEVISDLGVQLVWTSLLPRPNPDGDARSQRSCSPTSIRFALLLP